MSNELVLECRALSKQYLDGKQVVDVFRSIDLSLNKGETCAIVGASGSGKTTLLNLLAGLDLATSGDVKLASVSWSSMKDAKRAKMRNKEMGFVYQFHHLLAEFTALENVLMPMWIAGLDKKDANKRGEELLTQVGLKDRLHHKPSQLSGGERQRVAIARALANRPACVLMDEPTGNLDETTSLEIQNLINELKSSYDMAFLVVTHDEKMLDWMDSAYRLSKGALEPLK
ncbi:MAG: ABC transporter ATP-binding protein [Marinomonas sp.]|mgnify:CR=1 FL=1|jgi:lipoprotein-releasing system ATP-binding protein|uniref:Lipoprotein-releasing system ATP-binding protein LolD n=1 Tax=Marinomonas pontica TaxID=264739 RepID=A0ABN6WLS3_9GAMM|nr:ATP-binding cassette domain-containing protein [Marinomonas pontica]MCW8355058.1 ATP-binding cassette domain-containing protein [Marinomonas pontica]BDX02757.1 lipoprotein-releasing system ATP-binding protein LolD [Marinomonas pontica]